MVIDNINVMLHIIMFFGFFMIIKLAVRSWIPGLPSQNDETLDYSSNDPLNDSSE